MICDYLHEDRRLLERMSWRMLMNGWTEEDAWKERLVVKDGTRSDLEPRKSSVRKSFRLSRICWHRSL